MVHLTLDAIEARAFEALRRAGASDLQARPVARATRRAEADGISSVGLGYLPTYLAHLRSGKVDGNAQPICLAQARPAAIRIDAAQGFAHPAFEIGLDSLVAAARVHGIAAMSIVRSYSIGILGHPVEDIARRGLMAFAFTNSPPNMAAWGGRRKLFGTNPLAFAVPQDGDDPIVVDQATSVVTKVRLTAHAATGRRIPAHWAFGPDGTPTDDPQVAMKGAMAPFGGAKGANMALIVEIMAAVLTGANLSADIHPYSHADGPPPGTGQFFIAIDPAAFADGFLARIAKLAHSIRDDAPARVPGDRRLSARHQAERFGIDVDDALLERMID